jgi:hypothetical protein
MKTGLEDKTTFESLYNRNYLYAWLLPKQWHWTPSLYVWRYFLIQKDNLLCFYKIGNMSLIITASNVKPATLMRQYKI